MGPVVVGFAPIVIGGAGVPEVYGTANAGPGFRLYFTLEPQGPDRGCAIGNAFECVHTVHVKAAYFACGGLNYRGADNAGRRLGRGFRRARGRRLRRSLVLRAGNACRQGSQTLQHGPTRHADSQAAVICFWSVVHLSPRGIWLGIGKLLRSSAKSITVRIGTEGWCCLSSWRALVVHSITSLCILRAKAIHAKCGAAGRENERCATSRSDHTIATYNNRRCIVLWERDFVNRMDAVVVVSFARNARCRGSHSREGGNPFRKPLEIRRRRTGFPPSRE